MPVKLLQLNDVLAKVRHCFGQGGIRGVEGFAVSVLTDDGARLRLSYGSEEKRALKRAALRPAARPEG